MLNNQTVQNSNTLTPNSKKKTIKEMGFCSSLFSLSMVGKLKAKNHFESVEKKKMIFQYLGTVWEV